MYITLTIIIIIITQKTGRPFHDLPIEVHGIGPRTYLQYLYNPVGSHPFTIEISQIP